MKRNIIGTLVGGITLFLLGYLIYVVLLPNRMFDGVAAAGRSAPYFPEIIAGELLFGFSLTRALSNSGAIASVGSAIGLGAMVGGTISLAFALLIHANIPLMTNQGIVFTVVTWAIRWGVAGAVLSLVLGKQKDAAPAAASAS